MDVQNWLGLISKWSVMSSQIQFLSGPCEVEEVEDGYLNDVWRIWSRENREKSAIVKRSTPYNKFIGPDTPLSVKRIQVEFCALQKFDELLYGCVPKAFVFDDENHLVVMEDLRDYRTLFKTLVAGEFDIGAVRQVAESIATVHQQTHKKCVSDATFAKLVETFQNDDMMRFTYEFLFTNPFLRHHPTNRHSNELKAQLHRIYDDKVVQENAKRLRAKFTDIKECLIHGDLHCGSILVKQGLAKMFDLEFARIGPAAFDVGMLLVNYIISCYSHKLYPLEEAPDFYKHPEEAIKVTVSIYLRVLYNYMTDDEVKSTISDIAGFAGCELFKRTIGIVQVEDLEGRPLAELKCVDIGIRLLQRCTAITDKQQFLDCVFQS